MTSRLDIGSVESRLSDDSKQSPTAKESEDGRRPRRGKYPMTWRKAIGLSIVKPQRTWRGSTGKLTPRQLTGGTDLESSCATYPRPTAVHGIAKHLNFTFPEYTKLLQKFSSCKPRF